MRLDFKLSLSTIKSKLNLHPVTTSAKEGMTLLRLLDRSFRSSRSVPLRRVISKSFWSKFPKPLRGRSIQKSVQTGGRQLNFKRTNISRCTFLVLALYAVTIDCFCDRRCTSTALFYRIQSPRSRRHLEDFLHEGTEKTGKWIVPSLCNGSSGLPMVIHGRISYRCENAGGTK